MKKAQGLTFETAQKMSNRVLSPSEIDDLWAGLSRHRMDKLNPKGEDVKKVFATTKTISEWHMENKELSANMLAVKYEQGEFLPPNYQAKIRLFLKETGQTKEDLRNAKLAWKYGQKAVS